MKLITTGYLETLYFVRRYAEHGVNRPLRGLEWEPCRKICVEPAAEKFPPLEVLEEDAEECARQNITPTPPALLVQYVAQFRTRRSDREFTAHDLARHLKGCGWQNFTPHAAASACLARMGLRGEVRAVRRQFSRRYPVMVWKFNHR